MKALSNAPLPEGLPHLELQLVALLQRDIPVALEAADSRRRMELALLTRSHTSMWKMKLLSPSLTRKLVRHAVEAQCREAAVLVRVEGEVPAHQDHGHLVPSAAALRLGATQRPVDARLDAGKWEEEQLADGETGTKCVAPESYALM